MEILAKLHRNSEKNLEQELWHSEPFLSLQCLCVTKTESSQQIEVMGFG